VRGAAVMSKKNASGKKTVYPHVVMRSAATSALQLAEDVQDGSYYQCLLACLATAFAVEAYLNFLGEQLLPKWGADHEKKAPKDKLKAIAKKVAFDVPYKSVEYQAFTDVFALRNALAHGKVESISGSWDAKEAGNASVIALELPWEKFGELKTASDIHKRCIKLVKAVHAASGAPGQAFGASMHGIAQISIQK
jgi:hypothetical protein